MRASPAFKRWIRLSMSSSNACLRAKRGSDVFMPLCPTLRSPTLAATSPAAGLSPPPPVPSPASPLRSRAVPRGGTGARPSSPKELHSETSLAAAAAGEGRGGGGPSAYGAGGIAAAEHRWRSGTAPLIFCERDPGRRPRSAAAAAFSRAWRLPWTSCACSGAAAVGPRLPPRPIIGAAVGRPEVRRPADGGVGACCSAQ